MCQLSLNYGWPKFTVQIVWSCHGGLVCHPYPPQAMGWSSALPLGSELGRERWFLPLLQLLGLSPPPLPVSLLLAGVWCACSLFPLPAGWLTTTEAGFLPELISVRKGRNGKRRGAKGSSSSSSRAQRGAQRGSSCLGQQDKCLSYRREDLKKS